MSRPEVLVVGAGPVGLVAALSLRQRSVQVEIIDMRQHTAQHSYALAVHPRTLQVLDEAGLADRLIAAGRKLTTVAYYEGRERRAAIDYSTLDTPYPFLLLVRQSVLERAAEDALRRENVKVRWNHRLQGLSVNGSSPRADVATLDHVATGYPVARTEAMVVTQQTVHPAFVIGADGYDSTVRRIAGIEMADYGSQVFSIYEIEAAGELPDEARVILDADSTSVYWPLEAGRCRWGFQIPDAAAHEATVQRLSQLAAERAPWWSARPTQIYWSTIAVFDRRLARSFGTGGIWLAGDAAHQAAPVGVHSMNAGIVEARELAALIARVRRAGDDPAMLDEYAARTQGAWQALLGAGAAPRVLPGADPWVRANASRILPCVPASGCELDSLLQQIGLATSH